MLDRPAPGIAEAMRAGSLAKTPHAMLSRAVSGLRGRTLIINMPGSPRACREQFAMIAPALPHAIEKLLDLGGDCATPPLPAHARAAPESAGRAAPALRRRPRALVIPLPPEREGRLGAEAEARRRLGERPEPDELPSPRETVGAVVITFNDAAHIAPTVRGLLEEVAQVVVVDLGSTDETVAVVRRRSPGVEVRELPLEAGFGAALNAGAASLRQPFLLALHGDARLRPDAVEQLYATVNDSRLRVGCAGPAWSRRTASWSSRPASGRPGRGAGGRRGPSWCRAGSSCVRGASRSAWPTPRPRCAPTSTGSRARRCSCVARRSTRSAAWTAATSSPTATSTSACVCGAPGGP